MSEKREKEKRLEGLSRKTGYQVSDHGFSKVRYDGQEILIGYPKPRRSKYMPHVGTKQLAKTGQA